MMLIINSAACVEKCFHYHLMEPNFFFFFFFLQIFFWEGAEFNLHFITSFHPILSAVVSVNTGTLIFFKIEKKEENLDIFLVKFPFFPFLKKKK